MDIQLEKLELIKLLAETDNPSIINDIKKIFYGEKKDWWQELSDEQKAAIEEGIKDADEGRVVSHEYFMKKFL
ncbi:hypothetical protein [Flavobacterium sp.]|jgi:hypothetical protein|uniref:hypothetical protein n=1 Tax=Flavobacterium sp. TaxID=239 RepID=UPI0037C0FF00